MSMPARLRALERRATAQQRTAKFTSVTPPVPDIVEFCRGSDFLGLSWLYPRQATLLKIITLQNRLFTAYDREVIGQWCTGFELDPEEGRYVGREGIVPDVEERIDWCQRAGRRMFKEVVIVGGRRGSKTFLGAILNLYQILWFLSLGNPQARFGTQHGKRFVLPVFAGTRAQAKENLFADMRNLIDAAPVFEPFIAESRSARMRLWTPQQLADGVTDTSLAAIEVVAKESTPLAGRGSTAIGVTFDEMAWMADWGANRSADAVYGSAKPATQQFAGDEFILCVSSPWNPIGQFFTNYERGLQVNDDHTAADPSRLVVQLSSLNLYADWQRTGPDGLTMTPDGDRFPLIERPILNPAEVDAEFRDDPVSARTEYGAEWASVQDALLTAAQVNAIFGLYNGAELVEATRPILRHRYVLHLDPAKYRDNYGAVLAHLEGPDDDGYQHVVVDRVLVWSPKDFPEGEVDFEVVLADLEDVIDRFRPDEIRIDEYQREFFISRLTGHLEAKGLIARMSVDKHDFTQAEKREAALSFRRLAQKGLIHAPEHRLLRDELSVLQLQGMKVEAPTSGPIKTDDLADSIIAVATHLLNGDYVTKRKLKETRLRSVRRPPGPPSLHPEHELSQRLSSAGRRNRNPRITTTMTRTTRM